MTTKEKKRFWAKVLAFMLVASMMLSNLTVSTTFAAAVDETVAAEESAEDADKTIETVPEEPKADAPETEEPEADTLKEEELKTDASKEDVSEEENSEDKKAEVEESEETSDEKNKEDEVHLEDNQEGNQENDANQEKVTEEEGKDAASEDDKAADLDENGIAIDDSKADEEEVLDEEELLEEVPAEVQAFWDAVAALPEVEQITAENAEEIGEQVNAVFDMYEELTELGLDERDDVAEAMEIGSVVYEALLSIESIDNNESLFALIDGDKISSDSVTINPGKHPYEYDQRVSYKYMGFNAYGNPTNNIYIGSKVINQIGEPAKVHKAGSIKKKVGESGLFRRCAYTAFLGSRCGHQIGNAFAAAGYTYIDISYDNNGIVGNEGCRIGKWTGNVLTGADCLETTFDALKPGTTTATRTYYVNFLTYLIGGRCPSCYTVTLNQQTFDWHLYTDIYTIEVEADYQLNYDTKGGSYITPTTSSVANENASLVVTDTIPTRTGYKFLGWTDEENGKTAKPEYAAGKSVTLHWSKGLGSTSNPVSKTLYAVWEEEDEKEYTVIYTDGVVGEIVFSDQGFEELKKGEQTPEFSGTPERKDYIFGGWKLTSVEPNKEGVQPKINPEDANADNKIIYTAIWTNPAAKPELTKLEKERLTTPPPGVTLPNGVEVNYDPTVVFLGDNPEPVTLLYKITVKGTAGAEYKVTDHGAKWVSGGGSYEYQEDDLIITGTIAEGETSAEIYVTKTFTKGDIKGGKLTNEANLESQDPDTTKGPDGEDGKGSGTADTENRHKVIINFITDDEKPETLADPSENDFKENEGFGFNVNGSQSQRAARSNRADTGTTVISIPSIITKDGKTYILDEIESETALAALKAASVNGVTSDIIQNLIYTLDMKGGSAPDKEEGGSDGIPDKYQAKIVYQAAEGGSQTGKNGYVTIKNNDRYSKDGTTSVSAEAIADEGGYFTNWTAEAAGHDGWSYTASDNALLSSIPVKGGAVYTFTANFTQKAFLEIQITGSNATVTYNGGEQSVTGYTMTVRNENNEEISLPTGLTVTPDQADCAAKGTEVSETPYPMGLDSSKFTLGGPDAEKYSVTFQVTDGWLRITENDTLAVTAGDVSAVYDGNGHSVTPSANVEGARITVTYFDAEGNELPDAPKDAGNYTARIEAELEGYKTAVYEAAMTIHRRSLTVTTASAGKIYDGTPLTNSTAVVSVAGGAVAGEEITATATGSQTTVGSSTNTYRINWGNAKESNYTVTAALGTLTVTETTPPTPPTSPTPPTPPAPEGGGTGGGTGGGGGGTPDPTPAPIPAVLPAAQAIIPAAPPAAPAPAQPAEPEAEPVQEIEDEETPLASNETPEEPEAPAQNIEIEDEETPLAAPGAWALLNLILSILTVAVSAILLAGYFFGKKKDKEEEDKIQEYQDDEEQEELKRKGLVRILSILPAVVSVIFFILTEDMRNPMIFADRWTLWMLVFAVANGALLLLSKKTRKDDDDNKQKPGYEMA